MPSCKVHSAALRVRTSISVSTTFLSDRTALPRICIKGNWQVGGDSPRVVSVIRDSDVDYETNASIDANTGFQRVRDTGVSCLINNVPKAALQGTYKNPRFDNDKIAALRQRIPANSWEVEAGLSHDAWVECWSDYKEGDDARQFYRSTLIVPLTLLNSNLSSDFLFSILAEHSNERVEHFARTFVGFLCLDHVDVNYFNEDDIKIAYIFADLLTVLPVQVAEPYTVFESLRGGIGPSQMDSRGAIVGSDLTYETSDKIPTLQLLPSTRNHMIAIPGFDPNLSETRTERDEAQARPYALSLDV
jgi:hypothetical protein